MRLPDDMEVSSELWDAVIECMKIRAGDKVPSVRTFAIRSLSRFANDAENRDILELFLEKLPLEQNGVCPYLFATKLFQSLYRLQNYSISRTRIYIHT